MTNKKSFEDYLNRVKINNNSQIEEDDYEDENYDNYEEEDEEEVEIEFEEDNE